ncbi:MULTISPECIES: DUF4326 domain-containing protein [unclassified Haloferax]|jgi:hypothetical protein|uniref:DUF4326 domain-containing protein n=1 Tax=unclassified Haloferax TaxID=2625095 RepID=UPI0028756155|nr:MULTISPECIES: DUF4326 domain-containing protein [unclassified Haloferax]MDS0243112.1 DUF4326 domain-containing protein [Haloferax sp. S2CR25]MDS0446233.1 DUF4326 domain-containing protein [Haloferax sp. S2CR25-2]
MSNSNSKRTDDWFRPNRRRVRSADRDANEGLVCPSCGAVLENRDHRELPVDALADPVVAKQVYGETVTTLGWWCDECDIVVPESGERPELGFEPETWRAVSVKYDAGDASLWVPVRRDDFETPPEAAEPEASNQNGEAATVCHLEEDYDVYIGRGAGEEETIITVPIEERGWLGNPFVFEEDGGTWPRDEGVAMFMHVLFQRMDDDPELVNALGHLKGKRLACHCRRSDEANPKCHGDVLAAVIDRISPKSGE